MVAYMIDYMIKDIAHSTIVEAKDIKSAKKKLGKKHGYKDGRMIKVKNVTVIGYF